APADLLGRREQVGRRPHRTSRTRHRHRLRPPRRAGARGADMEAVIALALATSTVAGFDTLSRNGTVRPEPVEGRETQAASGELTVYVYPPDVSLDWSSPSNLTRSVVKGDFYARTHRASVNLGHVTVDLRCGEE